VRGEEQNAQEGKKKENRGKGNSMNDWDITQRGSERLQAI